MKKHIRDIKVGDRVFDCNEMRAGIVMEIRLDDKDRLIYKLRADDAWNKTYMDLDTEEDKAIWETEHEDNVYEFCKDRVDSRNGYPVCYEHIQMEGDYPYYCPVLDENLYGFETDKIEQ